jgi:hypothetical protein
MVLAGRTLFASATVRSKTACLTAAGHESESITSAKNFGPCPVRPYQGLSLLSSQAEDSRLGQRSGMSPEPPKLAE